MSEGATQPGRPASAPDPPDAAGTAGSEADGDCETEADGTAESDFSVLADFVADGLLEGPPAAVAEGDVEVELLGTWPGSVALGAGPAVLGDRVGAGVEWEDGVWVGVGSAA